MDNLNLNLLKYFYEVVNNKNITRASEKLLVSQPAITRAIKELEKELDTKLLDRSKKGVIPTSEGVILYEHIRHIFEEIDSTINTIELNKGKGKELYIGATTTNFTVFLKDALREFRNKYNNVKINIVNEDLSILSDMARLGKLDILIKNDYEEIKNFKEIKSFTITDEFIAKKEYFPELSKGQYSLEQLLKYPVVLLSNKTHGRKNFDNYLKSLNMSFKPTYEFNSYSLCRELINEGFGIGIGNPIHYQTDDFVIIKTDFKLPSRHFNIGYITTSKNELIKDFEKFIK